MLKHLAIFVLASHSTHVESVGVTTVTSASAARPWCMRKAAGVQLPAELGRARSFELLQNLHVREPLRYSLGL